MREYDVQKLSGENLKVVLAKFSTLSWAVYVLNISVLHRKAAHTARVENSAQVLFC